MFKQLIIPILLSASLTYSAAEDAQESVQQLIESHEIAAFACSSRGECHLIIDNIYTNASQCSLTFAYSEHPTLKIPNALARITENLHKSAFFSGLTGYEMFLKMCNDEMIRGLSEATEDVEEQPDAEPQSITLAALHIQLTLNHLNNYASILYPENRGPVYGGGSQSLQQCKSAKVFHTHLFTLDKSIESAQTEANELQEQNPEEHFQLVLNLQKWHEIIAEQHTEN